MRSKNVKKMKQNQRKAMSSELQATEYTVSETKRLTYPAEELPAKQHKMKISWDKNIEVLLKIV